MAKTEKVQLTGKLTISGTFAQVRAEIDKTKVRSRGPKQIGQSKISVAIRLGKVGSVELGKRIVLATQILETGKRPAKGADDSMAKLKEVQEKLIFTEAALKAQIITVETLQREKEEMIKSAFHEGGPADEKEDETKNTGSEDEQETPKPLEEKLKAAAKGASGDPK